MATYSFQNICHFNACARLVTRFSRFFEIYEFARGPRKLFVFRCFWPSKLLPGKTNAFPSGGYDFNGRINAALEGRRNVGGTMLAIAVANVSSQSVAIEKFVSHARDKIELEY